MNRVMAERTSLLALKIGSELDEHLAQIKAECSIAEFEQYRLATGKVMGELLFGMMNPIYREHPDLKPKELGGPYDVKEQGRN